MSDKIICNEKGSIWEAWEYGRYEDTVVTGRSKAEAIGHLILNRHPSQITSYHKMESFGELLEKARSKRRASKLTPHIK